MSQRKMIVNSTLLVWSVAVMAGSPLGAADPRAKQANWDNLKTLSQGQEIQVALNAVKQPALAADQTVPGAGNAAAIALSSKSPMVQSAKEFLSTRINQIDNDTIRAITLDAIANPTTCVAHRAGLKDSDKDTILQQLKTSGLVDTRDDSTFPGGLKAGVFPYKR